MLSDDITAAFEKLPLAVLLLLVGDLQFLHKKQWDSITMSKRFALLMVVPTGRIVTERELVTIS